MLEGGHLYGVQAALIGLALAVVVTVVASLMLLATYRRSVVRAMMDRCGFDGDGEDLDDLLTTGECGPSEALTDLPHAEIPTPAGLDIVEVTTPPDDLPDDADALRARMTRSALRGALAYGAAGAAYAAVSATLDNMFTPEYWPVIVFFCLALWPASLVISLVAVERRVLRPLVPAACLLLLVLAAGSHALPALRELWLFRMLPPTLALLAFANQRLRTAGPLVLTALTVFAGGVFVAYEAEKHAGIYLGLICLTLAAPLAWVALAGLARGYERRWFSGQMMLADLHFFLFAAWRTVLGVGKYGIAGLLFLLPFGAAWIVLRLAMLPRHAAARRETRPLRLLLLRVFGPCQRSEDLFEEMALSWRHVGSIQLIAGPDLAAATLEPHEFLDFLSGRLRRRFVTGPEDLSGRLTAMDLSPGPDGRYLTHDFFCHDDTWRLVLGRLARNADAVLMDLRGFTPLRQGCVFELHRLVNTVPLHRVILLVDRTTDIPFLRRVLRVAWEAMSPQSPNAAAVVQGDVPNGENTAPSVLRLLRVAGGARSATALVSLLSDAASFTVPAVTVR